MAIEIKGKSYELKYTIESWKKLKVKGINPTNIEDKLKDDFAEVISSIVYYGLSVEARTEVTVEELDAAFGIDIMDIVMPAIMANMPKSVKSPETVSTEKKP